MLLTILDKYYIRAEKYSKFGYNGLIDPYAVRYVFKAPDKANLEDGYTIYFDTEDYKVKNQELIEVGKKEHYNGSYHLEISDTDEFTAIKTEGREEGKRYKRKSFSALEVLSLYNGHNLDDAVTVIAKVKIYQNSNNRYAGEVLEERLLIGKKIGCWLYSEEAGDTKRRVDTHGVNVLGIIPKDKVAECQEIIKEYRLENKRLKDEYYDINAELEKVSTIMSWKSESLGKLCPDCKRDIGKIKNGATSIVLKINEALSENEKRRQVLEEEMLESLQKHFIKE